MRYAAYTKSKLPFLSIFLQCYLTYNVVSTCDLVVRSGLRPCAEDVDSCVVQIPQSGSVSGICYYPCTEGHRDHKVVAGESGVFLYMLAPPKNPTATHQSKS